MSNSAVKLALAERHVESGRRIVAAQTALMAEIKARDGDIIFAQSLLDSFYRTQAIFEDDLQRLKRKIIPET